MPDLKNTFRKAERLCNKKLIRELFEYTGPQVIKEYPFIIKWTIHPQQTDFPAQVVIAVNRKFVKTAVTRNRIKRLIREQYRCNKHSFYQVLEKQGIRLAILLLFTGKEISDKEVLKVKFEKLLEKFSKNIVQTA